MDDWGRCGCGWWERKTIDGKQWHEMKGGLGWRNGDGIGDLVEQVHCSSAAVQFPPYWYAIFNLGPEMEYFSFSFSNKHSPSWINYNNYSETFIVLGAKTSSSRFRLAMG